jgi:hypothetical protein
MGSSVSGDICFGVMFDEGYSFSWSKRYGDDIEKWWMTISSFKEPFKLYNDEGGFLNGVKPPDDLIDEYYKEVFAFKKDHPIPIVLVDYCCDEYSKYIVALPSSCRASSIGCPSVFNPSDLIVTDDEIKILTDFCEKYCQPDSEYLEYSDSPNFKPEWYLSVYAD